MPKKPPETVEKRPKASENVIFRKIFFGPRNRFGVVIWPCRSCVANPRRVSATYFFVIFWYFWGYIGGISGTYQGYIRGISPSLLSPKGGFMVRERGIPERINWNSLGAMVGPGPLGDVIVLLCCVVSAACRAVIVRWDLMNRTWEEKRGGVDARAPPEHYHRAPRRG